MRCKISGRMLALLLLLFAACGENGEEGQSRSPAAQGRPGGGGRRPPAEAAIPVKTEPVQRGEMVSYVQTHARLEAERQVDVLARTTGLVEQLAVEEGDRVEEGQILARLDRAETELRVQQARVSLQQVRATYDRTLALHDRKMVSEAEFETVRNQFENAKVALEEAELNLTYADIRAPISGVIMSRMIEVGDLVRSNQQLFSLADLEPLLSRIHIPEKRMHQIREGQEARTLIESLPQEQFAGRIRMISPGVDPQSGTVKVTLEISDSSGLLKPGMFASVRIIIDRHPQTLIIPKKGLIIETDDDDVFLMVEGKARRTRIELGFVEGDQVEVLSGLKEGDQVITVGQEGLKEGTPVRVVGAEPLAETSKEGNEEKKTRPDSAKEQGDRPRGSRRTDG